MATMKDVAERAGVSTTTVSHIINKSRPVSDELQNRVALAIEELGYRPYGLARSLRKRQTLTVGILIPDNTNPFFAEMARLLEDRFFEESYNVIICNTEQDPDKELAYLDLLHEKAVDGMVFMSTGHDKRAIDRLETGAGACVLVDRDVPRLGMDRVVLDNAHGAKEATRHLCSLGHKRVACIAGPTGIASTEDRLHGYREAIEETGGQPVVVHGDFQIESGCRAFEDLAAGRSPVTAVFASNDLMALGFLHAASAAGVRIPDDVSLVGFDDINFARYSVPSLTTVAQPKLEIADAAVNSLLSRIGNGHEPGKPYEQTVLRPRLVIRDTTATPGRGVAA